MNSFRIKYFYLFIVLFFALITFNSCSADDPLTPAKDHFDAEGLIITDSGIRIASIFRGVTSDTIEVPAGGRTSHMDVKFFDENQNIIDPPVDGKTLAWEIADTSILGVWQHPGEEGSFEVHFDGKAIGITSIEFFIMHEGHADFRSGKIPVKVKNTSGNYGAPIGVKLFDEDSGTLLTTINTQTGAITGSIDIAAGDTTDHIEVIFFDANGVEFQPPTPEHSLTIVTDDIAKAVITGLEPAEPFAFKVFGVSVGATTLSINLLHEGVVEEFFTGITINVQ